MGTHILVVAVGGALGALCRFGISALAARVVGVGFPWGTFGANMVGCFLIGVVVALIEDQGLLSQTHRLFLVTGFLGALTTFSTFALDSVILGRSGFWASAAINLVVNNLGGVVLVLAGIWLGRKF